MGSSFIGDSLSKQLGSRLLHSFLPNVVTINLRRDDFVKFSAYQEEVRAIHVFMT